MITISYDGMGNKQSIYLASYVGDIEKVRKLLSDGIDVNILDGDGISPLHLACQSGNEDIVKLLLEHGSLTNVTDIIHGRTPLHMACDRGRWKIIKILLEHNAGSIINKRDNVGKTPLLLAYRYIYNMNNNIGRRSLKYGLWSGNKFNIIIGNVKYLRPLLEHGATLDGLPGSSISNIDISFLEIYNDVQKTNMIQLLLGMKHSQNTPVRRFFENCIFDKNLLKVIYDHLIFGQITYLIKRKFL